MPTTEVPKHIFREYDIRGVVDVDLNDDVYYKLGRAYGTFLYAQEGVSPVKGERYSVVCGLRRPPLRSASRSKSSVASSTSGVDVINIGMVATPVMYFASIPRHRRRRSRHRLPQPRRIQRLQVPQAYRRRPQRPPHLSRHPDPLRHHRKRRLPRRQRPTLRHPLNDTTSNT